jgi:hypothetical protein
MLLGWRLGRREIVRPRRHWAWVPGPSTSPLEGLVREKCLSAKHGGAARFSTAGKSLRCAAV